MWDKVKRLGRNQRTLLKVLAPCGGPPQPVEAVRWLAALEVHGRSDALRETEEGLDLVPDFSASVDRSLDRLEERGLVERMTYPGDQGVVLVAPTHDGWSAIETLGLGPDD